MLEQSRPPSNHRMPRISAVRFVMLRAQHMGRTTCGKELNGKIFGLCVCPVVINCLPFPALDFENKCLCSGSRFCSSDTCTRVSPTIPMRCFPTGVCMCVSCSCQQVCAAAVPRLWICFATTLTQLRLLLSGQRTALWRVLKCAGSIF